jgi:hypothetical protein
MDSNERRAAKRAYAKERGLKLNDFNPSLEDKLKAMSCDGYKTAIYTDSTAVTIADFEICAPVQMTAPRMNVTATEIQAKYPWSKKKKAKAMYNDYDEFETPIQTRTDEQKKRDYLASRLDEIGFTKRNEARKAFHMDADAPCTVQDLIDRIKAGTFTLDEKKAKEQSAYCLMYTIDWHDPATPADEAGYRAARDAFKKAKTETQDQIKIADPADGLKAIQALEAWTPTGAAN